MDQDNIDQIQEVIINVARCEMHLDIALTLCDKYRIDGSYFARECLDSLGIMKCILEKQIELIEKST